MKRIVAGCYERFVFGWDADVNSGAIVQSFSRAAHSGPVKCAAAWGGNCVTGGTDDTIHVFDLRSSRDRDIGTLQAHKDAVTTLQFYAPDSCSPKPTHLFSGSSDGTICIWDADSWTHLQTMKAKAPVVDFAVHPCGKLGLSVQRDGGLRMWNLMKARCSFRNKLQSPASLVRFKETGDVYSLACNEIVRVHNAEDGRELHSFQHEKAVLCMEFQDNLLVTGGEDCSITAWDFRSGSMAYAISTCHSKRIKGLTSLQPGFLASVSSDGFLKVWDTRMSRSTEKPTPLMEADSKARLTCVVSTGGTLPASEGTRGEGENGDATEQAADMKAATEEKKLRKSLKGKRQLVGLRDKKIIKKVPRGHSLLQTCTSA